MQFGFGLKLGLELGLGLRLSIRFVVGLWLVFGLRLGLRYSWGCNSGYSFTACAFGFIKGFFAKSLSWIFTPVFLYSFHVFAPIFRSVRYFICITLCKWFKVKCSLFFFSLLLFFFPFHSFAFLFPSSYFSPSFLPPSFSWLVSCYQFVPASMFNYSLLFLLNCFGCFVKNCPA